MYPVGWVLLYGILKFCSSFLGDLRDTVFVNVTQHALRTTALRTFEHLHQLSLRFHLQRQTGGVLRAIERGTEGISFILTFVLFNIAPTLLEIIFVCLILAYLYPIWFALITFTTMIIYITLTLSITQVCRLLPSPPTLPSPSLLSFLLLSFPSLFSLSPSFMHFPLPLCPPLSSYFFPSLSFPNTLSFLFLLSSLFPS